MNSITREKIKQIIEKFEVASGLEVAKLKDLDQMRTVDEVNRAFAYDMRLCQSQVQNAIVMAEHALKRLLAKNSSSTTL